MIGCHEQPPVERALEAAKKLEQLRGGLEVAAIEDEARRARVAEQSDVRVVERRARQTDHQALADEVFEIRHVAILVMAPSRNGHPMNHEGPAGKRARVPVWLVKLGSTSSARHPNGGEDRKSAV